MKVYLNCDPQLGLNGGLAITGSKSETNRLLILQASYPDLALANCSTSDDSRVLEQALSTTSGLVDIHHAGTAMRFLTAYYATTPGATVQLTGSERMQQRPIGILVDALRSMGADIRYVAKEGYPPLAIQGKRLEVQEVSLQASVSSQYISALMLIAPALPQGLSIRLEGALTSVPYIEMTATLLKRIGAEVDFRDNLIKIQHLPAAKAQELVVESDWSAASYYYSLVALNQNAHLSLSSYRPDSYQGDSALARIYKQLGVATTFDATKQQIRLQQSGDVNQHIELDLIDTPDIAQTIAVTCFGLGIGCDLSGLHTLKIKETDRLEALKIELTKLGAQIEVTDRSLHLKASESINKNVSIATYQDHRMAMAFAPLGLLVPMYIEQAEVVTKSYPEFWEHLQRLGLGLQFE